MTVPPSERFSYFKSRNKNIIDTYNNGATIQELAARYQYTEVTIKRITGHREPRKSQGKGINEAIRLRNESIVQQLCAFIPIEEIADNHDVSIYTVESVKNQNKDIVKKAKADKELEALVKRHKVRLDRINQREVKKEPPEKYSNEWVELQWEEAHQRDREGVICQ